MPNLVLILIAGRGKPVKLLAAAVATSAAVLMFRGQGLSGAEMLQAVLIVGSVLFLPALAVTAAVTAPVRAAVDRGVVRWVRQAGLDRIPAGLAAAAWPPVYDEVDILHSAEGVRAKVHRTARHVLLRRAPRVRQALRERLSELGVGPRDCRKLRRWALTGVSVTEAVHLDTHLTDRELTELLRIVGTRQYRLLGAVDSETLEKGLKPLLPLERAEIRTILRWLHTIDAEAGDARLRDISVPLLRGIEGLQEDGYADLLRRAARRGLVDSGNILTAIGAVTTIRPAALRTMDALLEGWLGTFDDLVTVSETLQH